jgi:uncharacterized protein
MKIAVHCLDHPGAMNKRLENYAAHKAYLGATGAVKTIISGPLLAEDGETMIGSLFVFDAATLDDVIAFNRADPFNQAGVWDEISIRQFSLRVDNRE